MSTDCPFKLTYLKLHHEVCYRLVGYPQSFTLHNHPLPIDGIQNPILYEPDPKPESNCNRKVKPDFVKDEKSSAYYESKMECKSDN